MSEYDYKEMMPGINNTQYQVDQYITWGAGRAAALAVTGKFSSLALLANAAYMVTRIAQAHQVEVKKGAVTGFVAGLATAVATAAVSLLVPVNVIRVPAAAGLTYAIGKAADIWIADGMPADISRYQPMMETWFKQGKEYAAGLAAQGYDKLPQEGKDLWDGVENEAGWYAEKAKRQYQENLERAQAAKEKWDKETKYVVHDQAAETVAKASDAVSSAIDQAGQVATAAATATATKATDTYETAKTKVLDTKDALVTKAVDTKTTVQTKVTDVKATVQGTVASVQATAELAKDMAKSTATDIKEKVADKLGK